MMQTFRTEGNYRSADRLSPAELRAAIASISVSSIEPQSSNASYRVSPAFSFP